MVCVCTKAKRSVAPVPTIAEKVTLTRGSLYGVSQRMSEFSATCSNKTASVGQWCGTAN